MKNEISTNLIATFIIDDIHFGVDATSVQEIFRSEPLTRVPLAPPEVAGLLNLRGQVVTVIDLPRRLGMDAHQDSDEAVNIVVITPQGPVSFLVDQVGDVLDASPENLEPPPETISGATRELVTGVQKLDDRLILILNVALAAEPAHV